MTRRQFYLLCYVPAFVLTLLLIAAGWIFHTYHQNNLEGLTTVRHLIIEASEGVGSEAPLVSDNQRQYIPEVKLNFARDKAKLVYSYEPKTEDSSESIAITSMSLRNAASAGLFSIQNVDDLFESLPAYQRCQRPYILTTEDKPPTYHINYGKIDTITTNAKTIFVWQTNEALCPAGDGSQLDLLLQALKTAQSY